MRIWGQSTLDISVIFDQDLGWKYHHLHSVIIIIMFQSKFKSTQDILLSFIWMQVKPRAHSIQPWPRWPAPAKTIIKISQFWNSVTPQGEGGTLDRSVIFKPRAHSIQPWPEWWPASASAKTKRPINPPILFSVRTLLCKKNQTYAYNPHYCCKSWQVKIWGGECIPAD